MFIPITSEINIETGMVLKETATNKLFVVGNRLKNDSEVWGDDPWEIKDTDDESILIQTGYLELTEKYLAEVED